MIERELIPPVIKTGNLNSFRTWSDVRDAEILKSIDGKSWGTIINTYRNNINKFKRLLITRKKSIDTKMERPR